MSSAIDKALLAMSLEEEDVPFNFPDLPEFSSVSDNRLSLIGRLLNPESQNMSQFILEMPRRWQIYDRVRGVALSRERFQFIFKFEHDLEEVLKKGAQTHNNWSVAMERWVERPTPDFLQFLELWVQMRNIPVNYYTEASLMAMGEFAGQVIELEFDSTKSQNKEYMRVKVRFDISKPLRLSKVINLPSGEVVTILYDYENIRKRCFYCQRLTHDRDNCPLRRKVAEQPDIKEKLKEEWKSRERPQVIKESDPLFGVLLEDQVGLNPISGRPKIAPEVLEGMRQYLLMANGTERIIREERVKSSVKEAEKDPISQKSVLSLEPVPIVSRDLDKGKGRIFDFQHQEKACVSPMVRGQAGKLLSASCNAIPEAERQRIMDLSIAKGSFDRFLKATVSSPSGSTVYMIGPSGGSSSGTKRRNVKPRSRPCKSTRKLRKGQLEENKEDIVMKEGQQRETIVKRKTEAENSTQAKGAKRSKKEMVPNEGPSKF